MNTKDFLRLGVPLGQATRARRIFLAKFILGGGDKSRLHEKVAAIVANPVAFLEDNLPPRVREGIAQCATAARRAGEISSVGAKVWNTTQ